MRLLIAGVLLPAVLGTVPAQEATPVVLARIKVAETNLRCFASSRSPLFADRLVEGQVVAVGAAEGEQGQFRVVELPSGVTGYVHKDFVTPPDAGILKTKRPNVAFRYRPQTGEAPVKTLELDSALAWLADEGDWIKVRCTSVPCYLPVAELDLFDTPNETLTASAAALAQTREREWREAVASREQKVAAAAALAAVEAKLDEIERRLLAESQRPTAEQDLAPIRTDLDAMIPEIQPETTASERATALQGKLRMQQLTLDAAKLIATEPARDPTAADVGQPHVPDRLSFDATGWLQRRPGHGQVSEFRIEKGGKLLLYVDCRSGRYDLARFIGCEIGITGVLSRPEPDSVRVIDVGKLHVLSTTAQ